MTSENLWKKNWTKYIMQKASAVLTVSHHLKQEILNTSINPKKIIVTHNPVDTELFKLKETKLNKTILFVGRLDNFKGALVSVKAFDSIYKENKDWQFTIIGDGEDYLPITQYLDLNPELKTRVHLLGQKTKIEIAQQMQVSDFLVFPSKHESFGLVITEALSCGLPVIVGNTTAPKEFVDNENGLLVNYNSVEEIAMAMQKLINSHSSYNSQEIRNKIVGNFGFESFGKKMADIYNSIINKY
jgi:glycosyltransferase involved in cell wall biosynthesis